MQKIALLTVGVLLVIGLIGVGTFSTFQKVEAREPGPEFILSELTLSPDPDQIGVGQVVSISVTCTNIEDPGTADVTLEINGVLEATKSVELGKLEVKVLTFFMKIKSGGTYSLDIISGTQQHNTISVSFTVGGAPPTTTPPTTTPPTTTPPTTTPPTTTPPTTTTTTKPPTTTTTTTKPPTTTTTTPPTTKPPATTTPISGSESSSLPLIGGIIGAVVVVVLIVFFLVRRRKAA